MRVSDFLVYRPQTAPMGSGLMGSGIFGRGKNKITPSSTGRSSPQSEKTKGTFLNQ